MACKALSARPRSQALDSKSTGEPVKVWEQEKAKGGKAGTRRTRVQPVSPRAPVTGSEQQDTQRGWGQGAGARGLGLAAGQEAHQGNTECRGRRG